MSLLNNDSELSLENYSHIPKLKESSGSLNMREFKRKPQKVLSSQFLPAISKDLDSEHKKIKRNHI